MTTTTTELPPLVQSDVKWHRVPGQTYSWIDALHCSPVYDDPDQFILTMDGPRGGEHGRIRVTRHQLLEMIVVADKERARVKTVNAERT